MNDQRRSVGASWAAGRPHVRCRFPTPAAVMRCLGATPASRFGDMMHPRSGLDYGRFEALTFDCYGTLIDWEAGLADAFRPILLAHGVATDDEDVLTRFAGYEAAAEAGPYQRYRHVLAAGLARGRRRARLRAVGPGESATFSGSVVDWPAFPGFGRCTGPAQVAIPAGRDHQLRRRPVRRLERAAGRRLRLDRHRPAGPFVQARRAQLPRRVRAHRACLATASCMWPRACSTITCRPGAWA